MKKENNNTLNTHGLLEDPEIKAKFDESLEEETKQIEAKLANPPFEEEKLTLFEHKCMKNSNSLEGLEKKIQDDLSSFKKFNPNQKIDFIEQNKNEILNPKNPDKSADDPKFKFDEISKLRNFTISKWSDTLDEKTQKWAENTKNSMSNDFLKRMQAWFDAMLKAKELEKQAPELFGDDGLFGDAVDMVNNALDLDNLGDLKYQKKVLGDFGDLSDIAVGSKGFGNQKGNLSRYSIAQILNYFNMIKKKSQAFCGFSELFVVGFAVFAVFFQFRLIRLTFQRLING